MLAINWHKSSFYQVACGIPQGSPISSILFLFFNAGLFNCYWAVEANASSIRFIDDINLLVYGSFTESIIKILSKLHDVCVQWARTHGAVFEPSKYELIHLAKKPHRFNMKAVFKINNYKISPQADIRVLGVQIDTKLKWGSHIKKIENKLLKQTATLIEIASSIYKPNLIRV